MCVVCVCCCLFVVILLFVVCLVVVFVFVCVCICFVCGIISLFSFCYGSCVFGCVDLFVLLFVVLCFTLLLLLFSRKNGFLYFGAKRPPSAAVYLFSTINQAPDQQTAQAGAYLFLVFFENPSPLGPFASFDPEIAPACPVLGYLEKKKEKNEWEQNRDSGPLACGHRVDPNTGRVPNIITHRLHLTTHLAIVL